MLSQLSYSPTRNSSYRWLVGLSKGRQPSGWRRLRGWFRGFRVAWYLAVALAGVAKLVYAGDSKSPGFTAVRVRIPPPAPPNCAA